MVAKNTNLILDPAAAPQTPNGQGNIVTWYGGIPNIFVLGTFGGATVRLQACTRAPADLSSLTAADWVDLASFTAAGEYNQYLNPCLLSAVVSGSTGTTNLKVTVM